MSVSSLNDARNRQLVDLLNRCGDGDRAAFQELYNRTAAQLFPMVIRIVKRRDLSEDVLQEAYIKIWKSAVHYRSDRAAPLTWMTTVVRNQAIDLHRKLGRVDPLESIDEPAAAHSGQPEQLAVRAQRADRIEDCLDELTPQQSSSVRFAYLDGLTYVESAKQLGAPVNTVKSWVRRGLLSLKECLE